MNTVRYYSASRATVTVVRGLYREALLLLAVVASVLFFVTPAMADEGTAKIRMAHLSPDAPEVLVKMDGEPVEALANVAYKDASPYLEIPAGPHEIAVFATADDTKPVLEVEVSPKAGSSYTIAGTGLLADGTFGAQLFEDDTAPPEVGESKIRVIHAIPDVGPATVGIAGKPRLFPLPGFTSASNYNKVRCGTTYTLDVTPAGADSPAFSIPDFTTHRDKVYTVFAIGKASDGTVGAIITDDSDNGKVLRTQGGGDTKTETATAETEESVETEGTKEIEGPSETASASGILARAIAPASENLADSYVPVAAVASQSVAVINSGMRRRFVSIRKGEGSSPR